MHHIVLPLCRPPPSIALPVFVLSFCVSWHKAASLSRGIFLRFPLGGAAVVSCMLTAAPVSCHEGGGKAPAGGDLNVNMLHSEKHFLLHKSSVFVHVWTLWY